MALSPQENRQVFTSARQLPFNAPAERLEEFVSRVLGLNAYLQTQYFPDPDPDGLFDIAVANLTGERQKILQDDCAVPTFAVYKDRLGSFQIAGLSTYLEWKDLNAEPPMAAENMVLRAKLSHHGQIRTALRSLEKGQHLEALAAAIMNRACNYGEATRGSGDQGIDAIGWKELMRIDPAFSSGSVTANVLLPGEKIFLFASSKAVVGGLRARPRLLNPAHIRELVGGWIIQRTTAGLWQDAGIRMLSPVQMVLATTYRLSTEAKALCRDLGVQVWGIPELIYLVCRWAPEGVFDAANGYAFSTFEFRSWWKERDQGRVKPRAHA